jgi:formylglycine-generating enzyme required for sulfatase activity/serine/threonine protein kinase
MPDDPNRGAAAPSGLLATQFEQLAERFDAAWRAGKRPRIEEFLGDETLSANPSRLRHVLLELVRLDLAWRWKGPPAETLSSKMASERTDGGTGVLLSSRPKLEDYCHGYPALGPLDGLPDELILAEYDARHRYGDKPSHEDYCRRFPVKAERLVELLRQADLALAATPGKVALGETVALPAGAGLSLQPIVREQFLRNLEQSGLMTAEQAAAVLEGPPSEQTAGEDPADGRALAVRLVRAGRLTPYQAEQLCRGETGMLAFDEYVVLDRLGAGGMGEVLKAEHRSMGRLVAVKVLAPKLVDSPEAVKRFHREVRAAARLNHPNIVMAYDAREHAGRHCLVMEYVEGHDLGQIVKRQGPLPVAEAVDYVVQAARGLQFAHDNGIVHRDIKPANLLLQTPSSSSGRATGRGGQKATVKILDMGLARLDDAAGGGEDDDQLTGSSQMMGTCDYMAPEQAVDTHNVDHRADIYSLGCTLYRLVTGKRPYTGATPVQVLMAHREAPIPSLREGRDDVSPQLEAVYQRMVAKQPEDRQRSMAEVIEQLSACCVPEDEDDRPSDSALTAFLHEVAAQSTGTGLTRAAGVSSTAGAGGPPGAGGKLSSVAGVALSPAVSVARSLRPYLLVGGTVMVIAVLAALLAVALRPSKPSAAPGRGTLAFEGPLDQVQVVARYEQGTKLHELKLDGQGRVALGEGTYRLALARGYQQYRVVPDTVTITADEQVTVRIAPSGGEAAPPLAVTPFDAAQAKHHQQAWADYLGVPVEFENSIGMKFVLIPPGEFMMGSTEAEVAQLLKEVKERQEPQWYIDQLLSEAPRHRVKITRPFYLGLYEVTQAEYQRVMGANPSAFSAEGKEAAKVAGLDTSRHPVEMVSWNHLKAFCEKLSAMPDEQAAGRIYVLPTEAQWEYACRAGTTTKWSFGDDGGMLRDYAWYATNSGARTHVVGVQKPNAFGLFDMYGNVWEWCADWRAADYAASPVDDPQGPASGSSRVFRGGCWGNNARECRSGYRLQRPPHDRYNYLGFRLALVPAELESKKPELAVGAPTADARPSAAAQAAKKEPRPGGGTEAPAPATPWKLPPGSPSPAIAPFDAATARKHQEAWAAHLGKPLEIQNSIGMKFVLIPPGEFMMGSTAEEVEQLLKEGKTMPQWYINRLPSEAPRHRVKITRPFYLGLYEVTQAEYEQVMGVNPSYFSGDGKRSTKVAGLDTSRHPVEQASWDDAKAFLREALCHAGGADSGACLRIAHRSPVGIRMPRRDDHEV